ncbi:hypothetical protein THERMOT_34 [Bathymodiolus thermophilus thioautotrophic gill symbiont]|uniref:Integrating conjugative element protein n=1 Tax=Bathymodiolus thermophilus thioautotrophic gill symbiont TaxID=2360 RepID=A0A3G3IJK7_9GAMM|nr:hypothetical protein [Bathymodiolus thermophilus thioautotrophic gill symbiont]AYQ55931.1 hypothetical protein MS2017_0176 [Bathymodiolus thermophilus thioautotrophic gill symbiont]CAB5493983.1 hypothetical protein THERMOT_34 [Bathymodiolus thermophilus thioautotrophic gill symbiont]
MKKHNKTWTRLIFLLCIISVALSKNSSAADFVYKKILLTQPINLVNIESYVNEILVVEPNFMIVKINKNTVIPGISLSPTKESDFIQRRVDIYFQDKQQLAHILKAGVDIFHKTKQKIVGRAFDAQIKQLEALGLTIFVGDNL